MKHELVLPDRNGNGLTETIQCDGPVVVIGANGSGKSRLGAWIEMGMPSPKVAHRIAAQRSLVVPKYASPKNLEQALNELIYGNSENTNNKGAYRWNNNQLTTSLLSDYDQVLSTLFAEEHKRDNDFVKACRDRDAAGMDRQIPIPDSPIDILISIWNDIMPQRKLALNDGKVMVENPAGGEYHGREMSDGERVALYLMGQCLCAPGGAVLIIDEPEIHLHRSLMSRLWTKIEEVKQDCLFIYITHDIDFAASRVGAFKIWVRSFGGGNWVWDEVPDVDDLPEPLLLEIVGSRKRVLFTEGERGCLDYSIYQALYPDCLVIPRGGCTKVIESTKAMRDNPALHHVEAYGIIDRDFRTQAEMDALTANGVHTIDVAEVENLLCVEGVVREVASSLGLDPDDICHKVTDFVIDCLKGELDVQVSSRAAAEIQFKLNMFDAKAVGKVNLNTALTGLTNAIDVDGVYDQSEAVYRTIISNNDLDSALRIYNRKSLQRRIAPIFGLNEGEFGKLVMRLLKSDHKANIVSALRIHAPTI